MSSGSDNETDPSDSSSVFLAYWDSLGFETIINVSDIDKRRMWAALKGQELPGQLGLPLPAMMMRARVNPQREPEIWTFTSDLDLNTLRQYSKDSPQALADAIRGVGKPIFRTPKTQKVIE